MDDLVSAMSKDRRRFLRLRRPRPRAVDYKELLRPPLDPSQRCPHTMQVLDASQCSQCLGVEAERVRPRVVVPDEE